MTVVGVYGDNKSYRPQFVTEQFKWHQ